MPRGRRGRAGRRHGRVGGGVGRHRRVGGGFGRHRRFGGGFGRRRRRFGRRRRNRRTGTGGGNLLLCCFGFQSDPNQVIRKDVQELQMSQQQFLTYFVTQQQEQSQLDPATAQTIQAISFEEAKVLQDDQRELLDDILKRQMEEKDPEKLEELQEQQNLLVQQMQTFQASGFQYEGGIPQGQGQPLSQYQPMDTQTFQASGFQYEGGIPQGQGQTVSQYQPMYTGQPLPSGQTFPQYQPMDTGHPVPSAPDQLYS